MKISFRLVCIVLILSACAETDQGFLQQPDQYGLFAASTNLYFDIPLVVKRADTGETISIQLKRYSGNWTGYLVHSLPPGRYYIYSYSRYSNVTIPLSSPEGFFDIQANCFNYGGYYDFQLDAAPAGYKNITTLKEIEKLPPPIRNLAKGRDICVASMGEPNQRLTADELKDLDL